MRPWSNQMPGWVIAVVIVVLTFLGLEIVLIVTAVNYRQLEGETTWAAKVFNHGTISTDILLHFNGRCSTSTEGMAEFPTTITCVTKGGASKVKIIKEPLPTQKEEE